MAARLAANPKSVADLALEEQMAAAEVRGSVEVTDVQARAVSPSNITVTERLAFISGQDVVMSRTTSCGASVMLTLALAYLVSPARDW